MKIFNAKPLRHLPNWMFMIYKRGEEYRCQIMRRRRVWPDQFGPWVLDEDAGSATVDLVRAYKN